MNLNYQIQQFQFHKGTIKTISSLISIASNLENFNSIKVQLKQIWPSYIIEVLKNFNSIKVQLKHRSDCF